MELKREVQKKRLSVLRGPYGANHRSLASVCGQQVESGGWRGSVREGNSRGVVHGQAAAGKIQVQFISI